MAIDFRTAIRSMRRKPSHTLIHLIGLTVGFACVILIFRFAQDERSFDAFHPERERLYQVGTNVSRGDGFTEYARASRATAEHIRARFPQIEAQTMVAPFRPTIRHEGRYSNADLLYFAEPDFAAMFGFETLEGDLASALGKPGGLALTRRMKERYFGADAAIGKTLVLNDTLLVTVMAVLENPPSASHMRFDGLLSYATKADWPQLSPGDWMYMDQFLYILAAPGVGRAELDTLLRSLPMREFGYALEGSGIVLELETEPLKTLYLDSRRLADIGVKGSRRNLNLYMTVGFVILLLAAINYVNLSTARAAERAKEVGIRKVSGSARGGIFGQFMAESIIMSLASMILAWVLAANLLPLFNRLANKSMTLDTLADPLFLGILLALAVSVGFLSGWYPALVMSRFEAVEVLRGRFSGSGRGLWLRRSLVFAQFVISMSLVAYSLVITGQIRHMKERPLGFEQDNRYLVQAAHVLKPDLLRRMDAIRDEWSAKPGVLAVTMGSSVPGKGAPFFNIYPEGLSGEANTRDSYIVAVDEHFDDTFGIRMALGSFFTPEEPTTMGGWIINRRLLASIGWGTPEDAIGKTINVGGTIKPVVGVMEDFHYHSLKSELGPLMLHVSPATTSYMTLNLAPSFPAAAIPDLERAWTDVFPEYPFIGGFLDQAFDEQYQTEQRILDLFRIFTGVAVLIAIIGLYGMISYAASLRTREMGIRKVMGATGWDIAHRLTLETGLIVMASIAVAFPVAWQLSRRWLQEFAYRIEVGPDIAFRTLLLAAAVTLLATSAVVWQALRKNPAEVLRTE